MSKQDRVAPRTAADIERKYNFGQTFAEFADLIDDAQRAAEEAQKAVEDLDKTLSPEEIFNRLTDDGKVQGIYRADDGQVYINARYLVTGILRSKNGDTFYLDLDKGVLKGKFEELSISGKTVDTIAQEKANTAEGNAKAYADTAASGAVSAQTQTDIFNKLTNNGALPGLFMLNGQMYINADYLATGVISSKSGTISVDLSGDTLLIKTGSQSNMEFNHGGLYANMNGVPILNLYSTLWAATGEMAASLVSMNGANLEIGAAPTKDGTAGAVKIGSVNNVVKIKGKSLSWKDNGDGTYILIGTD